MYELVVGIHKAACLVQPQSKIWDQIFGTSVTSQADRRMGHLKAKDWPPFANVLWRCKGLIPSASAVFKYLRTYQYISYGVAVTGNITEHSERSSCSLLAAQK
jgi:hypothetical protein